MMPVTLLEIGANSVVCALSAYEAYNLHLAEIKKLMELYKQLTAETISVKKCKVLPDGQQPQEVKVAEQPQPDGVSTKPSDNKSLQSNSVSTKQQTVDGDGSQIIGGSAFGWNFITFSGSEPVYSGVTKESFRSSQVNFEGS